MDKIAIYTRLLLPKLVMKVIILIMLKFPTLTVKQRERR